MFEYITALAWGILIAFLLDSICHGSPSKEEVSASATSRVVERLKNGGAQHVMAAQPAPTSSTSSTSSAPPSKVFFKTAKPNAKFDTAFLAKATPVTNVREGELAQLQEAHVVAKGREIVASAIGEEPRNSRSSFSEETGKSQERVRSTERRESRSSFSELTGDQEQGEVSASDKSVTQNSTPARMSSSEKPTTRPVTPETPEVLVRGGSEESSSEAEGSERKRDRRNSADFVLLHAGPSPHASPAGVSADYPSPEASPAAVSAGLPKDISEHERSIRVDYNGQSYQIPVHQAMTLQALRPLVALAVGHDTQLRAAATGESLNVSKDTRTLGDLGLMHDLHVIAE